MKYPDYSRIKPKYAKTRLELECRYCKKMFWESRSKAIKKKRHYCSMKCYSNDRKENWTREEQNTYKGMTAYKSHRKYVKANPERIAHLKARRYAREKNADGTHLKNGKSYARSLTKGVPNVCRAKNLQKTTLNHFQKKVATTYQTFNHYVGVVTAESGKLTSMKILNYLPLYNIF